MLQCDHSSDHLSQLFLDHLTWPTDVQHHGHLAVSCTRSCSRTTARVVNFADAVTQQPLGRCTPNRTYRNHLGLQNYNAMAVCHRHNQGLPMVQRQGLTLFRRSNAATTRPIYFKLSLCGWSSSVGQHHYVYLVIRLRQGLYTLAIYGHSLFSLKQIFAG